MDTDRIAGLSLAARPLHALVVLKREEGRWRVESARTADTLGGLSDPGCPVVIDASGFWQAGNHHLGGTDAALLRGMGWLDVRAPVTVEGVQRNPRRVDLESNLTEMMDIGRLRPVMMLDPVKLDALRLAAWGARQVDEQQAAEQFRARLMPWQRATCEQLDAWLASDEVVAIVVGQRRSGKSYVVESWAKATGRTVEIVRPVDDVERVKVARCDLMVLLDAGHHDRRTVASAILSSRTVLVSDPPTQGLHGWLVDLVEALRKDGHGRVIECAAPPLDEAARRRVERIARIIDPEAR